MRSLRIERYILAFNDEARFLPCTKPDIYLSILRVIKQCTDPLISLGLHMIHVFRPFKIRRMICISVAGFIYIRLFIKKLL